MKSLHGMVSDPNNEWVKIHHDYGQDINARQVALSALKGDADGFVRLRRSSETTQSKSNFVQWIRIYSLHLKPSTYVRWMM